MSGKWAILVSAVPGNRPVLPSFFLLRGNVTFQVGDKVIYPNHGLGIVERIEEKTILGTTCGFFHLRIVANDTTVLVPVANVDGVGLRKAITRRRGRSPLLACWATARSTTTRTGRAASRTIPTRCAPARSTTWPTCSRA